MLTLFDLIDLEMAEELKLTVKEYKKGIERCPNDAVDKITDLIFTDENPERAREIYNKYQI